MRIIDASDDKQHFFVRVTKDGRLLYCRHERGLRGYWYFRYGPILRAVAKAR